MTSSNSISFGPVLRSNGNYYLTVGRLEKQKRVDILIHACNQLGRKLVIAGTGKEEKYLKSIAGPSIEFCGYVADEAMTELYANCKAFLFAAVEDFGIAPVEAQAYAPPDEGVAYGEKPGRQLYCKQSSIPQDTAEGERHQQWSGRDTAETRGCHAKPDQHQGPGE